MRRAQPPMGFGKPRTIRFRVVSLVVLIVTPLLLFVGWLAVSLAAAQRELIEMQRASAVTRISLAFDRGVAALTGALSGLATEGDLHDTQSGKIGRLSELTAPARIVRVWTFAEGGSEQGKVFSTGRSNVGTALPADLTSRIFAGDEGLSGVLGTGDEATIVIAAPIVRNGRVASGLAAEVEVVPLGRLFAEADMEENWIAAVVDRDGKFVARSLHPEIYLGLPARPELAVAARGVSEFGTFANVTHEGLVAANAYRRSPVTGLTTVVAVPTTELLGPLRQALSLVLLGGAAVLGGTLLMAIVLASRISEPVRSLSTFAGALAGGESAREPTHHIIELDEVRLALELAMAQSARLSAIVASSGDAIMSIDLDGTIRTWNKGAEELCGYTAEEIIGKPKTVIVPPSRLAEFEVQRLRILAGETIEAESVRRRRDGKLVEVSLNSAPIRRPDGKIVATSSIIRDITERRAAEKHTYFLMRELAHRSKNQLAIIQSIASQTARGSRTIDEFLANFAKRLQGLAASHDLLMSQDWKGASLGELVRRHLAVFAQQSEARTVISGPEVWIGVAAAESLGLALHELATNSTKYGALSAEKGQVEVTWSLEPEDGGGTRLVIDWKESGGPPVTPPTAKGFGSQVTEKLVATTLCGRAVVDYLPEGVRWHFECPLPA